MTSFKFKLQKLSPIVMSGPIVFPFEEAKEVFRRYAELCKNAPEELSVWSVIRHCPPFPFVDASYAGQLVLILVGIYAGPMEEGKKVLSQLKGLGLDWGRSCSSPLRRFPEGFRSPSDARGSQLLEDAQF